MNAISIEDISKRLTRAINRSYDRSSFHGVLCNDIELINTINQSVIDTVDRSVIIIDYAQFNSQDKHRLMCWWLLEEISKTEQASVIFVKGWEQWTHEDTLQQKIEKIARLNNIREKLARLKRVVVFFSGDEFFRLFANHAIDCYDFVSPPIDCSRC